MIKAIFLTLFCLSAIADVNAQTKDYYPGKWDVMVFGTPYGDVKLTFILERKDGKLGGVVQDSTGKEITKINRAAEKDNTADIDFTTQGYDVTLSIEPVDDNHVKGRLAGFEAKGVRKKEDQ